MMRLLKASTTEPELVDFPPDRVPPYAILSHTWGQDEVTFADLQQPIGQTKSSWSKVQGACRQAVADGYGYIWIDACCIDKSSSAELSEAINSMFTWYANSAICYVYLSDIMIATEVTEIEHPEFAQSRWFTRGWTLQELLAPSEVVFFSQDWSPIGKKHTLTSILAKITRVDEMILKHDCSLEAMSIAHRMSWAADRHTTRPEDVAYCLMGIFSVNMPMMYGEGGERAFLRLQEEIMKQSDDQTIFAWSDKSASPDALHGLLASSPRHFANSENLVPYQKWEPSPPYAMTNRGLRIDLSLEPHSPDIYGAALYCSVPHVQEASMFVAVYLKRLSAFDNRYARIKTGELGQAYRPDQAQTIYVPQKISGLETQGPLAHDIFYLRTLPSVSRCRLIKIVPRRSDSDFHGDCLPFDTELPPHMRVFSNYQAQEKRTDIFCFIIWQRSDGSGLILMLGSSRYVGLGFNAVYLSMPFELSSKTFNSLRSDHILGFQPQKLGSYIKKGDIEICVTAEEQKDATPQHYMLDINIQSRS
ncbi:hypothetical protein BBP40_011236 [Aspergillus hancockii]|nr:hypothetical protein BBP40_011236 [Aspergillus hancockii]